MIKKAFTTTFIILNSRTYRKKQIPMPSLSKHRDFCVLNSVIR